MDKIIGLKDLRYNMEKYANKVKNGESFIILKRNKPVFKLSPVDENENWEEVINFTKIKKGGIDIDDLISVL